MRRERPKDVAAARAVQVAAFPTPERRTEPIEAELLDNLRRSAEWMPALSLVAELEGVIVGHVVTTRGYVGDVPALGLGPIGVLPSAQGRGVGLALLHASLGAADALDEPLVALLGSPLYYARFGFMASTEYAIEPPTASWGPYFQVRTLHSFVPTITGTFRYAAPFDGL